MEILGQVVLMVVEFAELYVVFNVVTDLGGFSFVEVLLMFALSHLCFGLADLIAGQVEHLAAQIRNGTFDAILLRPMSALGQLMTSEFQLRRVGRVGQAAVFLAIALVQVNLDWTVTTVLLLVTAVVSGAVIYCCVFIAGAAVSFWVIDGREFANAFTYGGSYVGAYPFTIYPQPLRSLFTFVIPAAFVSFIPAVGLLGRAEEVGLAAWLPWTTPLVAVAAVLLTTVVWRTGLRRYVGTGS